jgi:hypothetical protein
MFIDAVAPFTHSRWALQRIFILLFLGISKNSSLSNQNTYTLPWLAGSYHQQTHRLFS